MELFWLGYALLDVTRPFMFEFLRCVGTRRDSSFPVLCKFYLKFLISDCLHFLRDVHRSHLLRENGFSRQIQSSDT